VEHLPDDVALRLHLAEVELAAGLREDAIATIAAALRLEPTNTRAQNLMTSAIAGQATSDAAPAPNSGTTSPAPEDEGARSRSTEGGDGPSSEFDWDAAEGDLDSDVQPAFVGTGGPEGSVFLAEQPTVTLADVGGLDEVKERLNASFLAPLTNPELRQLYGKSLRGGLLMYGPPGCGKTFIARAVAGELGASFLSIGVADVLDQWLGRSERNIHEMFMQARRGAPCVVFLDELDTLGQRRSTSGSAMTGVVNQLLTELAGFAESNEGVFVLAATNQPWQVDPALRRPGRFDRTLLVLPPDPPARAAIFRHHLQHRPVEGIDVTVLADRTDGFTGADIAYVCEAASERALMDSVRTGTPRMISLDDVLGAVSQTRPSIGGWLDTARNVVTFGEDDGTFAQLRAYLKKAKRL
jgi:SpoVK/Ycf46/Vps4 family AAA+-type ATPase